METIYQPDKEKQQIKLNEQQKNVVKSITLGIEEVDETVRNLALDDVINTLENGHPLNRIIEKDRNIEGYIACEDFVKSEAYIKYLGTTRQTGKNLLLEIPAFLEYAKSKGYSKLNFHGWNDRLNNILTRYGFERIRTDKMAGQGIDFYEKILKTDKTEGEINEERLKAFEQKYINQITQEYQNTLKTFKDDIKENKIKIIDEVYGSLSGRLSSQIEFGDKQKAILKLKLARYFQNNENIDQNNLYDAIIETPNFINTDKGSLFRLFELHQEKTLMKIAEMRKKKAEQKDGEVVNPYEALFETKSGNYYMARLLNMPHLEEESAYMNHCVGTRDSYINKIKKGDIEILSFRNTPKINKNTNKLEGDTPIITIEYNLKTQTIKQMKKANDKYLTKDDPYYDDVIDALKQLKNTETDTGKLRDFKNISSSELDNIEVPSGYLLTENGEISIEDFDIESQLFVLKIGNIEIGYNTPKEIIQKVLFLKEGIKVNQNDISKNLTEVNENTKVYIGDWNITVHNILPYTVAHIYENNLDNKIFRQKIELSTKTSEEYTKELIDQGYQIGIYAQDILNKLEKKENKEEVNLVSFTVAQLGFTNSQTLEEIYTKAKEFGLELCDPHAGPEMRLQYKTQKMYSYYRIAMDPISGRDGDPLLFEVHRSDDGEWLYYDFAYPKYRWNSAYAFVFSFRKHS